MYRAQIGNPGRHGWGRSRRREWRREGGGKEKDLDPRAESIGSANRVGDGDCGDMGDSQSPIALLKKKTTRTLVPGSIVPLSQG